MPYRTQSGKSRFPLFLRCGRPYPHFQRSRVPLSVLRTLIPVGESAHPVCAYVWSFLLTDDCILKFIRGVPRYYSDFFRSLFEISFRRNVELCTSLKRGGCFLLRRLLQRSPSIGSKSLVSASVLPRLHLPPRGRYHCKVTCCPNALRAEDDLAVRHITMVPVRGAPEGHGEGRVVPIEKGSHKFSSPFEWGDCHYSR